MIAGHHNNLGCSADTRETYHCAQVVATLTQEAGHRLVCGLGLAGMQSWRGGIFGDDGGIA